MPLGRDLRKRAGRSLSRMQALLALGTGAAAEPVAGVAGLYGLLTGGLDKGARNVHATREALTYQPTRPEGLNELGEALRPIVEPVERAKSYLGDGVLDATGSPAAATAAYMAPEVLATLVGARMSGVRGPTMQQMAERSQAPTGAARQLGIFAGPKAATADHGAMNRAAQRLAAGDDPKVVWAEEGWMRGPDGKMRFEIDDSPATSPGPQAWEKNPEIPRDEIGRPMPEFMGQVTDHPELFRAYDVADTKATFIDPETAREIAGPWGGVGGAFDPKGNEIWLGQGQWSGRSGLSTQIHELQHAVQSREGFARGGGASEGGYDAYRRLAGEAEARAAQKRLDYTPEQRRAIYPLDDYDVPIDELILRGQSDGPQMAIGAWHGSPHDFDRFDMSRIGTGEGAQAYGHGLYFAGNKRVARQYAENVKDEGAVRAINVKLTELAREMEKYEKPGQYRQYTDPRGYEAAKEYDALMSSRHETLQKPGKIYDVELAPDETDLLDWDAPLSEQPEKVRAALDQIGLNPTHNILAPDGGAFGPRDRGRRLYNILESVHGSRAAATAALNNAGIPGIRYLDGGSRAAGDGTRNYVMFDDSLVKIRGKE